MTLPVYRLRRWLAVTAVLFTAVVAGMYFYARARQHKFLTSIPARIGLDIKQTATGFEFSKSDGKRTLFTIRASDLKQFKLNGRAELHNVSILLYGRDSSRFDQIYGDDFAYDPKSGNVTANGEVQIDLEANPSGLTSPDQTTPKELKNPIHLKTRDLVFNNQTGNATTDARVEFQTPEATGSAVGVQYLGKSNALTLISQIHVALKAADNGVHVSEIQAAHGVITSQPRQIVLDDPRMQRSDGKLQADHATFFLDADNNVERILAEGNVTTEAQLAGGDSKHPQSNARSNSAKTSNKASDDLVDSKDNSEMHARSDQAELLLTGKQNLLRTATLSGNVKVERTGLQPMQGEAGRVVLAFVGQNELKNVHAAEGVRLSQRSIASGSSDKPKTNPAQDFELTAPIIDFRVADGRFLQSAVTSGAAQIKILPAQSSPQSSPQSLLAGSVKTSQQQTIITAGKFNAKFGQTPAGIGDDENKQTTRLTALHGAPNAKIVSKNPGEPDRVSTSETVDASFLAQGGIESVVQEGNVAYTDGLPLEKRTQAWADRARYTPADQLLTLTGNPRVDGGSMATTATTIHINRATGDATADGDVKSTYSELKEQPNGALLASSSPIHVTAQNMVAHHGPNVALYSGNARLWQDANIIEAPSIQFDREHRFVTAQGSDKQPVSTVLIQAEKTQAEKTQTENASTDQTQPEQIQAEQLQTDPATHKFAVGKKPKNKKTTNPTPSSPVSITAARLTYSDVERKAHYDGGVQVKGVDFTAAAKIVDAYFLPRSETSTQTSTPASPHLAPTARSANASPSAAGQLNRMVAQDDVTIQQPGRRATGQTLVYTTADDKFVLTGGPPSIFDAEQGKITGVSLTFFRRDDRVLVEGEANTPVVTRTRVAH